jgi:hypothetical protein
MPPEIDGESVAIYVIQQGAFDDAHTSCRTLMMSRLNSGGDQR